MSTTMPLWRQFLLTVYYHGTWPMRRWQCCDRLAKGRLPLIVLCYHRVADDRFNPWTVSNRMFARQIAWLQKRFEFISIEEVQRRIRSGTNDRPCVSVTFDDGYTDNCHQAIPLLIKERIPCTYFVTSQNVLTGRPLPHDLARGDALLPNTLEQLQAMADAGVEIGSHTCTHADLARVNDLRQLRREVVASRHELESLIGRPVRYFAFPFGQYANLSREAIALAHESGYEAAFSACGGYNFPGSDPFLLQRIPIDNNMIRMKNWVTVDPRKLCLPRFEYASTKPPVHVTSATRN